MGGYGALVLDTIGAAAAPVLLLIGEENKHHGVLEVLRETIEVFPGIFDDTADMMRHGKARYAVEKGDDSLIRFSPGFSSSSVLGGRTWISQFGCGSREPT